VIWNLSNDTPYVAFVTLAADRDGRDLWLVVVKATFDIHPDGSLSRAAEQVPVTLAPIHAGEPARSSLLLESDIDYAKPGVDVVVQGTVRTPRGEPAREVVVGLEVNGRRKLLRALGDRMWEPSAGGVVASPPALFVAFPLVYERAFGGYDPEATGDHDERNPAGCGYARNLRSLLGQPAPNLEYPDEPVDAWRARTRPAGLGPVARSWRPRRDLAGTYDRRWEDERMPLLPLDFDERFFLCAPSDQQFESLPGRAVVRLVGMTDDAPLAFKLPYLALGLNTRMGEEVIARRPALRTVLLLPDRRQVVLVYHDAMPCTGSKYSIADTEVFEKEMI
jgi:hypothetical protein